MVLVEQKTRISQRTVRLSIAAGFLAVAAGFFGFAWGLTTKNDKTSISASPPSAESCVAEVVIDQPVYDSLLQGEVDIKVHTVEKFPYETAELRMEAFDGNMTSIPLEEVESRLFAASFDSTQFADGAYDVYAYLAAGAQCWRSYFQTNHIYNSTVPPPEVFTPWVVFPEQPSSLPYYGQLQFRGNVTDLLGVGRTAKLLVRNIAAQTTTEYPGGYTIFAGGTRGQYFATIDLRINGTYEVRGRVCDAQQTCWDSGYPRTLKIAAPHSDEPPVYAPVE